MIKFYILQLNACQKARVFVRDEMFKPCQIFVGKVIRMEHLILGYSGANVIKLFMSVIYIFSY